VTVLKNLPRVHVSHSRSLLSERKCAALYLTNFLDCYPAETGFLAMFATRENNMKQDGARQKKHAAEQPRTGFVFVCYASFDRSISPCLRRRISIHSVYIPKQSSTHYLIKYIRAV